MITAMDDVMDRIEVIVGDITQLPSALNIKVIVNAANPQLKSGGGVDGAIHRAAGQEALLAYNARHHPQGIATGLAVHSPAFDLAAQGVTAIVHTAGPVWEPQPGKSEAKLGYTREDTLLASCYTRCLDVCVEESFAAGPGEAIAFPAISTGVYGYPADRAAKIAFGHVHGHLLKHAAPSRVVLCFLDDAAASVMRQTIEGRTAWMLSRSRIG